MEAAGSERGPCKSRASRRTGEETTPSLDAQVAGASSNLCAARNRLRISVHTSSELSVDVLTSSTFWSAESLPVLRQKVGCPAMSLRDLLHEIFVPFSRVSIHVTRLSWALSIGSERVLPISRTKGTSLVLLLSGLPFDSAFSCLRNHVAIDLALMRGKSAAAHPTERAVPSKASS